MNAKKNIENFWYYHKFHLLAALLALIALIVAIKSCAARKSYDVNMLLITRGTEVTAIQTDAVADFIAAFGDGITVQVKCISYGRTAQEANSAVSARLALLAAGDDLLYLLDGQDYNELKAGGFIADLAPYGGNDDKLDAARIGLLEAAPGLDDKAGYVLCLRVMDKTRAAEDEKYAAKYAIAETVIKNIIDK